LRLAIAGTPYQFHLDCEMDGLSFAHPPYKLAATVELGGLAQHCAFFGKGKV